MIVCEWSVEVQQYKIELITPPLLVRYYLQIYNLISLVATYTVCNEVCNRQLERILDDLSIPGRDMHH